MKKRMKTLIALSSMLLLVSCQTPHKHSLVYVQEERPTCVDDGHLAYWKCTECEKIYADENGKQETTLEEVKTEKTGIHQGGTADCTHQAICEICRQPYGEMGEHHFEEIVEEKYLAKEANCLDCALYYLSCSLCGETSTETFSHGEPLGHQMEATSEDKRSLSCTRCEYYGHIYEFDEMRSNAWRGEEYDDKLWKIAASEKDGTFGEYYVGHINDNSIPESGLIGKTYMEFDVLSSSSEEGHLKIRAALGGWMYKKAFKVTVNGEEISVGEEQISSETMDWKHWETFDYASIPLRKGKNTIRFTIMESAVTDLDYALIETSQPLEAHTLQLSYNGTHHYFECIDEGCNFQCDEEEHVFDQEIAEEAYWKEGNVYYRSCKCGKVGNETFEVHVHEMKSLVPGKNDVLVCDCGKMSRKFDLATSFSNSWSEGTEKYDALWRQMSPESAREGLDSGYWISHINDVIHDGTNNDKYWIEIGVRIDGDVDQEVTLSLFSGISSPRSWDVLNIYVNQEKIENHGAIPTCAGWDDFRLNEFGTITLKANQVNRIRISPNQGCEMNWCYLQIDSDIATTDVTQELIQEAINS